MERSGKLKIRKNNELEMRDYILKRGELEIGHTLLPPPTPYEWREMVTVDTNRSLQAF
jgi:hypothetical protein